MGGKKYDYVHEGARLGRRFTKSKENFIEWMG
jgi:hypothetical protein